MPQNNARWLLEEQNHGQSDPSREMIHPSGADKAKCLQQTQEVAYGPSELCCLIRAFKTYRTLKLTAGSRKQRE